MGIPALNILTKDTQSQSKVTECFGYYWSKDRIYYGEFDTSDVDNKGFVREGVNSDIVLHDYVFVGVFTNDKAKYRALKYLKKPFLVRFTLGNLIMGFSGIGALYLSGEVKFGKWKNGELSSCKVKRNANKRLAVR